MNRGNIYLWGTLRIRSIKCTVSIFARKIISGNKKRKRIPSAVSSISLAELWCEWIMNILDDVTCLEAEGYLQQLRWVHRHEPLSYHDNAWPGDVADPPSVLVGHRWCFKEWIIHIAWDYWVICDTVWSLSQGIVWCFQGSFSGLSPIFVSVITKW